MKRMNIAAVAVVAAAFGAAGASAQVHDWKIDSAHSEAGFSIKHMAVSTVHGSFHNVDGIVKFDPANVTLSSVEATVDVNTVDTGNSARDGHLKGADFFDAAKFPTMTFKSTGVRKDGAGYAVMGNLTLHGVTKPVVLALETPGKSVPGMDGKSVHRGFVATTTINRKDFGLVWAGTLKSGDAVLGDDVKVELDIEAVEQ